MLNSQRGAKRRVGYNNLISKKREWNNCFIKNAHKNSLNLPDLFLSEQTGKDNVLLRYSHVTRRLYQNWQHANRLAGTG